MINKPAELTSLSESSLPALNNIIDTICKKAISLKNTSIEPTSHTVAEGEIVIYDDGAGIKRLYVMTAKKNLAYISLT